MSEAEFAENLEGTKKGVTATSTDKPKAGTNSLRGALKLEASTSTSIVSAGAEFSIYVVIRNPFPVPVTIFSTETHIPIELSDEIWRKDKRLKLQEERTAQIKNAKSVFKRAILRCQFWLSDIHSSFWPETGPRVAVAVSPEDQKATSREKGTVNIAGQDQINVAGGIHVGDNWKLDFAGLSRDEIREMLFEINEYMQGRQPIILNAGDSVVKHFVLKTTRWLTFAPISHIFQIQVRYEVDGQTHVDTVPFSLNIRAATASSMIGSIFGSILGSMVNQKFVFTDWPQLGRTLLTASIFAVIIVVAFARKSNVQQIVSVEDFWGGMFIGFLVGYSGDAFINSILGKPG